MLVFDLWKIVSHILRRLLRKSDLDLVFFVSKEEHSFHEAFCGKYEIYFLTLEEMRINGKGKFDKFMLSITFSLSFRLRFLSFYLLKAAEIITKNL